MLARMTARALPVINRTAEHTPMATTCCNTCRTCVSSNIVGLAMGGVVALASGVRDLVSRRSGITNA